MEIQTTINGAHEPGEDVTFTGELVCENTDNVDGEFSVTVGPDGKMLGDAQWHELTDELWMHDACRVTFYTPEAPAGFRWKEAEPGYIKEHERQNITERWQVPEFWQLVKTVELPEIGVNDQCGPDNASWVMPENDDTFSWQINEDGELIVSLVDPENNEFDDGTSEPKNLGVAPDNNEPCPEPEPSITLDPPTEDPSDDPTGDPTDDPTGGPTEEPTEDPTEDPTRACC